MFRGGSVASTDEVSTLIEDLQFALGEGPCVDAYREDRPVVEPDLVRAGQLRWPGFTPPAVRAGVGAVFGFPLRAGAVRLGSLNLYRTRLGPLEPDGHGDALIVADLAAEALLMMQAGAAPGDLAAGLEDGSNFQYSAHQAAGMMAVQLEVTVAQALIRLRGYAFGANRSLAEVADDVIARRLRFSPDDGDGRGPGPGDR